MDANDPQPPETVLDRLHRTVRQSGGRYEEWRVGARPSAPGPRPAAVFAERLDPTLAFVVVDHLKRLGAQADGWSGPDADEVFAYRPEAWRGPDPVQA